MRAYERLLEYVKIWTTSDEESETVPSTARQLDLAALLTRQLTELGLENVHTEAESGIVYAWLPATAGLEALPALGFIAHMDTAPDFSGENVRPQVIEHYDGKDVLLAGSGDVLSTAEFPDLKGLEGMTLITTDGTTLLGADDKAGVAEIMTALESVIASGAPHRKICIAFTPDEEIGMGTAHFSVPKFGAATAYTVDGGEEGEIAYETFNACSASISVKGFSVHPGSSKGLMINAGLVCMELNAMLPAGDIPRLTEDHEGFFHMTSVRGDVNTAEMHYIIRDHDHAAFEGRKQLLTHAVKILNEKYGEGTVALTLRDSYYNTADVLKDHMDMIDRAMDACRRAGMKPFTRPVRGGTDGAKLSYDGLPCPDLCTGAFGLHGRYEHIAAESMDRCAKAVELLMLGTD